MITKPALFMAMLGISSGFFLAAQAWADDEINITDDTVAPTATAVPPVGAAPTATPIPVPVKANQPVKAQPSPAPQASPTPQPAKAIPTKAVPSHKPAVEEELEPGAKPEDKVGKTTADWEGDVDESPIHTSFRKIGVMDHPLLISTVDLQGGVAFGDGAANYSLSAGFGLSCRVELQVFTWLSVGTYYDLTVFPTNTKLVFAGPWGFMGRIIPFKNTGKISPYLIGGLGLNTVAAVNSPRYPGNFHGFAGLGARVALKDHWGLDFGLVYNYYSPQLNPLDTVSARAGLSYEIGM